MREVDQAEENQLMEERKKRKDDKKKDAAQKKASEQKNKVPEPAKVSISQPRPASPKSGTSTAASTSSNAKRVPANSQLQASPRYSREVPPRFRHQEQKQLLKRGQQLPTIAANLGPVAKAVNGQSVVSTVAVAHPVINGIINQASMPPIRDLVSHSPNQSDLKHSGLGSHYEKNHWASVSSSGNLNANWEKVIVDGSDKEAWPSITGSDPELASECMDADSASNSGSENNLSIMASGSTSGDSDGGKNNSGRSSQKQCAVGNGSNNMGNGSISGSWGGSYVPVLSTSCQGSVEGPDNRKLENCHSKSNAWGSLNSSTNGGVMPSTLNLNAIHGHTWPVLENNGHNCNGPVGSGNSSSNGQSLGQIPNNQSSNSKVGIVACSSWGGFQENTDSEVNGTQKVTVNGQPHNLNTEINGPNNTTNFITSSLPNSTGLMQVNELPNITGHGAWRVSTANPQLNGTSVSQLSNGEEKNGGSHGTTWVASGTNYSAEKQSGPDPQASGDTVNATLMQPGVHAAGASSFKNSGGRSVSSWELGAGSSHNLHCGMANGVASGGIRRGWGNPAQNSGTNVSNGEWSKLPNNQHSNDNVNGNGNKKGTNGLKYSENDAPGSQSLLPGTSEQNSMWSKTPGTGDSEGSTESTGSGHEKMTVLRHGHAEKRKADQLSLQSILSRTDLDPRVLSNSGWGQTPIKQNTAWDIEASPRSERKTDNGTEGWGCSVSQTSSSGGWGDRGSPSSNDTSSVSGWGDPKRATGWGDTKGTNSQASWDADSAATAASGMVKSNQSWGNNREDKSAWNDAQKVKQGWTDGQKSSQGWVGPGQESWGDVARISYWGESQKANPGWNSDSDRSVSGWSEPSRSNSTAWGNSSNPHPCNTTGWGESSKSNQSEGWGDSCKPGQSQTWGEISKPSNSPDWNKHQDVNGSWGVPSATNKPSGSAWQGVPIPVPSKEDEPTGWEEPSPESIRRKMEIDDGTSAWGDPSKYNYKTVNMWNKNVSSSNGGSDQQTQLHPQPAAPSSAILSKDSSGSGWGEPWTEPGAPATTVDNGTSAWGKPVETGAGWGESASDTTASSSWSSTPAGLHAPHKPGPKPMQDGWCGDEMSLSETRHPSWEEEEGREIGVWNSSSTQEMHSSLNWTPYMKKVPSKGTLKGGNKQEDTWANAIVNQFSNLSFNKDSAEEAVQSNKMDLPGGILQDKRMDLDKHCLNVGEYNGIIGKSPVSRPHIPKESSMDRSPYFDKDGIVAEEPQTVQFMSSQNSKLPPSNSALPNQLSGSGAGLGTQNLNSVRQNGNPSILGICNAAAQVRAMQQAQAQPVNASQPNLRAQVPPPLLSPQVPASLLKYAPNSGGLSPLFGPQQVAMLSQLSQLNQLSQLSQLNQLQRLLLQQQKVQNQRNMTPCGRQQDQQCRPINMQQPRQLDPNLLMKQQNPSSQQQPFNQPAMKPFIENLIPPAVPELQKGPSPLNAFSSFPLGGFLQPSPGHSGDTTMPHTVQPPILQMPGFFPCGSNPTPLSPPLVNGGTFSPLPGSPNHQYMGRKVTSQESRTVSKGLNSNLNVNSLDINSINFKEPQSRLRKWTAVDSISVNPSLDQTSGKHGAISSGFRLEEPPFVSYDFMNNSNSSASPPGPVGDGWSRAKSPSASTNINWPPEFRPGEPWKGYPNIDPETDPYVTPGSVINNLSINTVRDVDHLRDRNNGSSSSLNTTLPSSSAWSSIRASNFSGSLNSTAQSTSARNSDSKSAWSPGPLSNTSLAHELWKVPLPPKNITAPSRPPPGLTSQKTSSPCWDNALRLGGGWSNTDSRYTPGSSWSDGSSGRVTNWLVLKNLTPQIDGSTLRTLCMQHGPLITFHLSLPHGNALVRYSSKEEAIKAQKSLHMCVLGNTTILAEFATEGEINRFFAQGQSLTSSPSWQSLGSSQNRIGPIEGSHTYSNRNDFNHWNGAGLSGTGSGDLHGTSLWGTPTYSASLWGTPSSSDTGGINSPSPINAFLPVDHLGGESM
ncbi:trinucleotide repeat-containing gene 6A protein isoform X4 [Protopterus annectens]|uniref:trinucleotide repeat-containing gene 6A protein isoform X4 n=1 Tax=Protopterus annectens TaxID=7888 RepID=UPI001CFC08AD|nr:trinucleotide repeat-containing gene 6A protein isoform X4 [Protopterus annectens]